MTHPDGRVCHGQEPAPTFLENGSTGIAGSRGSGDATCIETGPEPTVFEEGRGFFRRNLPDPLTAEYELISLISDAGTQADVYRARRRRDGSDVAIKLYKTSHDIDGLEADLVAHADPAHVVPTEFGRWGREQWEIQEYMPLGTLRELPDRLGRTLSDDDLEDIAVELARAVGHIHAQGMVHRDIKPTNVLVRAIAPLDLVLADFGLARTLVTGSRLGSSHRTQGYAAPEVLQGIQSFTSDWWALGISLLETAMGRHPFSEPDGRRWNEARIFSFLIDQEVDPSPIRDDRLRLLVSGLLVKDRRHRWDADDVAQWIAGGSPAVWSPSSVAEDRSQTRAPADANPIAGDPAPPGWRFAGFPSPTDVYTSTRSLGRALSHHWAAAAGYLAGRGVTTLRNALTKTDVADQVASVFDRHHDGLLDEDAMLFELVGILDPHGDPVFRGRPLTADGLTAAASAALAGDLDAASWITALRTKSILQHTTNYPGYPRFVAIDDALSTWWDDIHARTRATADAKSQYLRAALVEEDEGTDLQALLDADRPLFEGTMLACALDWDRAKALHERVPQEDSDQFAPWLAELIRDAHDVRPVHPGLDLMTAVLQIPARIDHDIVEEKISRDQAERRARAAQEEKAARAHRRRARISDANGGAWGLVTLAVAYLLVVGFGFAVNSWSLSDHGIHLDGFSYVLYQVALGTAVALAVQWVSSALAGRPFRWLGAVFVGLGFFFGWFAVTGSELYWMPLITGAVGYALACVASRYAPISGDAGVLGARLPRWLRTPMPVLIPFCMFSVPLTITVMAMSMHGTGAARVNQWVFDFHGSVWSWAAAVTEWFGGLSRVEPNSPALWTIPCLAALAVVGWAGQRRNDEELERRGRPGFRNDRNNSRNNSGNNSGSDDSAGLEGLVVIIITLGMLAAIFDQWALFIVVTSIPAIIAFVLSIVFRVLG